MYEFYNIIGLITAGASLSTGLIHIFIGSLKGGEKTDFVFGVMSLSIFIFFLVPPIGFILEDKAPYLLEIKIKRIFNFGFSALLPWFIFYYTGFKNKVMPLLIGSVVLTCYIIMWFTKTDSLKPAWVWFVLLHDTLIVGYGFYGCYMLIKQGERAKAKWFLLAMFFVAVLYALTMINQIGNNYFGKLMGTKLFFPENLYPLPIILIMGIRLRANIFEKYRLEKLVHLKDTKWNSLVQGIHLLVVEIDINGKIKYINPFALKVLGYRLESELLGKDWFDTFVPKADMENRKSLFTEIIKKGNSSNIITNLISGKGDTLIINWTNVLVHDAEANITGSISIGLNITDQEKAFEEVRALKNELAKEGLDSTIDYATIEMEADIIGKSQTILSAIERARTVADTTAAALLEGETGVGKELFANLIHRYSRRRNKPFIKTNCAAFPAELIESELFGHEKGAFTGALHMRKGRFELANGGTIFLDEIAELPLALQPKLLRVLQNGEFERVGGQETIKVDVRVISATNKNLLTQVKTARFREDLYYRLNVFPIAIPALRERKGDIELLVKHFIKVFSGKQNKQIENVSKADMMRLVEHPWPGNIRELINVIERSIISSKGSTLKLEWPRITDDTAVLSSSIEEVERLHILKVLKESNWKINGKDGAALKLGLNPNTLRSRLKKMNIARDGSAIE